MNTFNTTRFAHAATALGLSLIVTLATLGGLNGLASEQHAASVIAKAAAALQAQGQTSTATASATRG